MAVSEREKKLEKILVTIVYLGATIAFSISVDLTQVKAGISRWSKTDFEGKKMDYALWVKNGGEFSVWGWGVEEGTFVDQTCILLNKAFLYFSFNDQAAKEYYHDTLMNMYNQDYDFHISSGGGDRSLCDILESYILMREEGVFSLPEQEKLETRFRDLAYQDRKVPVGYHQAIVAGLNALTGYILNTTKTKVNYSEDVENMWNYAKKAKSFDDTWSLPENSLHYAGLIIKTMFRVAVYTDNGRIINEHQANLKKTMEWILDVFPHNGFAPAFGRTFYHDHVEFFMDALHAGAYYLRDYDIETAQNCKWLATKMFEYGINHPTLQTPDTPRRDYLIRSNPMWIWKYVDDSLPIGKPDVAKHGSKAVYRWMFPREVTHGAWDGYLLEKRFDKLILRDSWDEDAFYLQIEAAPSVSKNEPFANSITNFVYGSEPFSTGHTLDSFNPVWTHRNVISPTGQKVDASFEYLHDYPDYVASKTSVEGWHRHVGMIKKGYAVVYDFSSGDSTLYWHLQGTPTWHTDYVELRKGDYQLNLYYPSNGWFSSTHEDKYTWNEDSHQQYWYVGDPSRELKLKSAKTFATVLYPYRGENPTVTAITPTQRGMIWIEAEDAQVISSGMKIGSDINASGEGYIYAPKGSDPHDKGYLEYEIDIPEPGTYRLWARCYWPDTAANSFLESFDGGTETILGNDLSFDSWHWVPGQSYPFSEGKRLLRIRDREDGSRLDKLLLTPSSAYIPKGVGEVKEISIYPEAVGVKLVHSSYTDWNGVSHATGKVKYDIVTTDVEMFWARKTSRRWTLAFVKGGRFEIMMGERPIGVRVNDDLLMEEKEWIYSSGILRIDSSYPEGTVEIFMEGLERE